MKRFETPIKIGTRVIISGVAGWQIVKAFHNDRKLVELEGLAGQSQRAHIMKYTNKLTNSKI